MHIFKEENCEKKENLWHDTCGFERLWYEDGRDSFYVDGTALDSC